jgi:hypothetical protein
MLNRREMLASAVAAVGVAALPELEPTTTSYVWSSDWNNDGWIASRYTINGREVDRNTFWNEVFSADKARTGIQ